jgi:predicted deacetylase
MKTAIISVHDVSPRFQSEIETILQHFEDTTLSLLVTPLWDGEHPLTPDFVKILRGAEKILHGLTHRNEHCDWAGKIAACSARSDRELYGLSRSETMALLTKGKRMFEQAFDESPLGFVPPTWYHNPHSVSVLREMGFSFTEKPFQLIDLDTASDDNLCIKTPAVCYDYGNNSWMERLSIGFWRRFLTHFSPALVRVSIHPSDVENGFLPHLDTLLALLKANGYAFQTYREFLNKRKQYDFSYNLYPQ